MTKAQRINRSMFALGFLGAYSLAALLLLLMLKTVSADRHTGAGVTYRNADFADSSNDFTSDIAALSDFGKYPNRLGPDKGNSGTPDDSTSAIGEGPSGSGFFADNGFSSSPEDLQQASFVTSGDAGGRANFAPPLTSGGLPEGAFGGGGGAPFGGATFIPLNPGGPGPEPSPTVGPPVVDTPPPNPAPDPFIPGPPPGPSVPGPDIPPPDLPPVPGPPLPPGGPNPPGPTLSVPEPLTLSIFAVGLAGAAALRRRRKISA